MHLLLITGRFPQRSETFIYRKAVALAERGHRVTLLTRAAGDWSLYDRVLPPTLEVLTAPPDNSLRQARRAVASMLGVARLTAASPALAWDLANRTRGMTDGRRHFLRHLPLLGLRPDIVHFEFVGLGTMYPLARTLLGAPVIVSCRGQDIHGLPLRTSSEQDALLATARAADAIHCVSDELAQSVRRLLGDRGGIYVNRPAVDTDSIQARPFNDAPGPLRILTTGRLVWHKGFDYFLAALARLARRGIELRADILGAGPLETVLRFSVADLGLQDRVTLAGGVSPDEVLRRMQTTDVFVLPSYEEGISNAVLEAMACGVPVVTTAAGGMREAIRDGVEGVVVPIRDVAALADGIERLARDTALRRTMGLAARARAVSEFSLERQVTAFENMYRSVREAV